MNQSHYSIKLDTEIKFLKGVGPQRANILNQNNIYTIEDIIRYYPRKYLDRTNTKKISELIVGEKIVVLATVKSFGLKNTRKGKYFHLLVDDKSGTINCLWFHGISWIIEKFKVGDNIALFGKIEFNKGF
ncbi:MAG: ATP-dependent DNA helicase RecG, partial [Gammaproteobacteria bacterium]|nr:ATP-dependent DNA helicase RecG [Gammaproteobacteria bacterium]